MARGQEGLAGPVGIARSLELPPQLVPIPGTGQAVPRGFLSPPRATHFPFPVKSAMIQPGAGDRIQLDQFNPGGWTWPSLSQEGGEQGEPGSAPELAAGSS